MRKKHMEVEGFGVSYDRFMLIKLHKLLVEKYRMMEILEMPSYGVKAASMLYSLGFALEGVKVTVTDFDASAKKMWDELGLDLSYKAQKNYMKTNFKDNEFDCVWSFINFSLDSNPIEVLKEMKRISKKYVLLVCANNFQIGYPWHKLLHKVYNIKWNHWDGRFCYPWNVKKYLKEIGLNICETGTIDSPPWPDPVGFRDIRLHKKNAEVSVNKNMDWKVPFVNYVKINKFPLWMKVLSSYDVLFHKGLVKLPVSHLFYVFAQK